MHLVQRGSEPVGLQDIRSRYTQGWVNFYRSGIGNRPSDRRWRDFVDELSDCFSHCCGYCETLCKGQVDHFQPKKRFPELVYEWDNWVLACPDCNNLKGEHWPSTGFIDPCTLSSFCKESQCCVVFALDTGEVLPHPGLSRANKKRVEVTIRVLNLNITFHLKQRIGYISKLDTLMNLAKYEPITAADSLAHLCLPSSPLSSLTRYYMKVNGIEL